MKQTPIITILFIILGMSLLSGTTFAQGYDLFGGDDATPPLFGTEGEQTEISRSSITVTYLSQDPDPVEPGEFVDLRFRVENYGSNAVPDVRFTISLDYPFSLAEPEKREINLGTLGRRQTGEDSAILYWRVRVDDNAAEGEEEFELSYTTRNYGVVLDPYKVRIRGREAVVAIDSVSIYPEKPKPGQDIEVNVTLHNLAESAVDEVKVQLQLDNVNLAPIGSASEKVVREILSGEKKTISFDLAAQANAASKVHLVPITVEYTDKFNQKHTLDSRFGVTIYNPHSMKLQKKKRKFSWQTSKEKLLFQSPTLEQAT